MKFRCSARSGRTGLCVSILYFQGTYVIFLHIHKFFSPFRYFVLERLKSIAVLREHQQRVEHHGESRFSRRSGIRAIDTFFVFYNFYHTLLHSTYVVLLHEDCDLSYHPCENYVPLQYTTAQTTSTLCRLPWQAF